MPHLWDVIIVGAGPAGCAAAYDLAAAGYSVVLVDKASFPRSKACAGGLTMKAVHALRYSIDPVVRKWIGSIVLEESAGSVLTVQRKQPVCAMTVREELDSFCLQRTRARGAAFEQIGTIRAVEQSSDRVVLHLADGASGTRMEARFLIGADGVHSRVRALATDAAWFRSGFAVEANVPYITPGEQYPLVFDFAAVPRGYGWLFPRDTHVNVGLYVEDGGPGEQRAGVDRAGLDRYIERRCGVARPYTKPVGQFLGLGAAAYRPAAGTRVLLAGDAAGFVDPLTGEGIYGAIRSGQAAAEALNKAHRAMPGAAAVSAAVENAYAAAAKTLQDDLLVAEHASRRFFADPARGFQLMRLPLVSRAVLKAYAEGLNLGTLLRGVRMASRLAPSRRDRVPAH